MKNCALFFTIFTIFIWPEITHVHTQIIAGLFQRPEKTWISKTVRVTLSTRRKNCVIITFWFLYFFYRQKLNRFFFIAWRCAWFLIFVLFVIRILFSRLMIMMMIIITIFLPITIFLGFQACFSLFLPVPFSIKLKCYFIIRQITKTTVQLVGMNLHSIRELFIKSTLVGVEKKFSTLFLFKFHRLTFDCGGNQCKEKKPE